MTRPPAPEGTQRVFQVACAIAEALGDNFYHAHEDKREWVQTRGDKGGRFRDVNEPTRGDYLAAAGAAIAAINARETDG